MPIKIPNDLPALRVLRAEGVTVMSESDAIRQDIRPLRIGLLNLMPTKIRTETQFARLLGATPLQIELTLVKMASHTPKNTPAEHMIAFYRDWEHIRDQKFDGFVVTGAPVELLEFEAVTYWNELSSLFEWTQTHVHSTMCICWGAQAALYHFHGVRKHTLGAKAFGVFRHKNLNPSSPFLSGFSDDFSIPV
jgi:homoserine O-succinyltransferase/O-acetyltransferase